MENDIIIMPIAERHLPKADRKLNLSPYLFWDCNIDMIDFDADKALVMERVFTRGTENDEREIFKYYGSALIKETVVKIKYLDRKTMCYLSAVLDIPKRRFKCYAKSVSAKAFGI